MSIEIKQTDRPNTLEVILTGSLTSEDYERFVPTVERAIEQGGPLRLLVEMHEFHGWSAGALWEDIKFDLKHFRDIERLALVGERKWESAMATFCRPFTTATIRYFDSTQIDDARRWLLSAEGATQRATT